MTVSIREYIRNKRNWFKQFLERFTVPFTVAFKPQGYWSSADVVNNRFGLHCYSDAFFEQWS